MTKTKILDLIKTFYKDITVGDFNSSYFAKPKYEGLETKPHQDNAFFLWNQQILQLAGCH